MIATYNGGIVVYLSNLTTPFCFIYHNYRLQAQFFAVQPFILYIYCA